MYIALNMVHAGVVDHPVKWEHSGYHEIQQPPKRYTVIDLYGLLDMCGVSKLADFQQAHCQWIEAVLHGDLAVRDARCRKRLQLAAWLLSRRSKANSESKHRVAKLSS
jgi:putative transposase